MKVLVFLLVIFMVGCGGEEPVVEDYVLLDEMVSVFRAKIVEMADESSPELYGGTILVDGVRGRMVFDHRRLEDIGAEVGDIVEITVTGVWPEPDPAPIFPDSWRLVEEADEN